MSSYLQKHQHKKGLTALLVTILAIALPMVEYDGLHLLLFNFYDQRFELFFHAWEVNVAGLITLFFIVAVATILLLNLTYARYFCGHICPKTLLRNLLTDIIEARIFGILRIKNRLDEKNFQSKGLRTLFAYLLFAVVVLAGSMPIFFYFMPYEIFFWMLLEGFSGYRFLLYIWLLSAVYLFAEALFFKEFFCSYLCPYQLVNSVTVNDKRGFYSFDNKAKCIDCGACVKICPVADLDVREGFDTRCIACGDCAAVCHDVMAGEGGGDSLIHYEDFTRQKRLSYLSFADKKVALSLVFVVMLGTFLAVYYLVAPEHLGSCRFSNAFLYR